ncbi:MAG TPA: hypothetical protein VFN10_10080 [Thermoanaerobaculia bacterium]|nr:hypothetical protein [Thermoanaerobaculia bacterium]
MRKLSLLLLPLIVACASHNAAQDANTVQVSAHPQILIVQRSSMPVAAQHVEGGLPVKYAMRVDNPTGEPITLTHITMQTVGGGAYTLNPNSQPFNKVIEPGATATVEFWMPAYVTYDTVSGSNGPVTVRAQVRFKTAAGSFEETTVQQVGADMNVR